MKMRPWQKKIVEKPWVRWCGRGLAVALTLMLLAPVTFPSKVQAVSMLQKIDHDAWTWWRQNSPGSKAVEYPDEVKACIAEARRCLETADRLIHFEDRVIYRLVDRPLDGHYWTYCYTSFRLAFCRDHRSSNWHITAY